MMNEMLVSMKQDMDISTYKGESQEQYFGRIIYSALCQWMRYIILDEMTLHYDRKSKIYILNRMKVLLNSMIDVIPLSKKWIFGSYLNQQITSEDLIKELREKMLISGELIEVDDTGNIGLPQYTLQNCTENYHRVIGLSNNRRKEKYIGITRVVRFGEIENDYDYKATNHYNIADYIDWVFNIVIWSEVSNVNHFEFFDSHSKRPPYQSWTNHMNKNESRYLARLSLFNGMHEYYLVKKENEKIYSGKLPEVLEDYKEQRRILLGFRKKAGNCMNAQYSLKQEVVILNLYCKLPLKEKGFLDTYCWPLNFMSDEYNFVIPNFIWNDVKIILENNLGINLKENN